MAELRWLLLVTGIVIVGAIYVYTRYKPSFEKRLHALGSRREPSLDNSILESGGTEADPVASPDPAAAADDKVPTSVDDSMIVAIRLMARDRKGFKGDKLILTLREVGLQHGEFGIFHRISDIEDEPAEFSVASLLEPGAFDLTKIKTSVYPGVSIFMLLPGSRDGVEVFDDMLTTARSLSVKLDGELLDEHGSTLSVQRERYLREEVIAFEHGGKS